MPNSEKENEFRFALLELRDAGAGVASNPNVESGGWRALHRVGGALGSHPEWHLVALLYVEGETSVGWNLYFKASVLLMAAARFGGFRL